VNANTTAASDAHTVVPLTHFSHGADILRQIEKEGKPNYTHKTNFLQANRDVNLTLFRAKSMINKSNKN